MTKNTWDLIKEQLATKLPSEAYQSWVAHTHIISEEGGRIRVGVPNDVAKYWMESEYSAKTNAIIRQHELPVQEVVYEVMGNMAMAAAAVPAHANHGSGGQNGTHYQQSFHSNSEESVPFSSTANLNHKLKFESFVVGSCNQFAHAAAKAVATAPSRSYNPLFIYGGTGMGKTHLIHAIGQHLLENFSRMRVVYTSGERFMNEMINGIRTDRMTQFQNHYRSADVLLIDDIHILGGKERTQEELFHTFNALYDHQKQIVFSSDSLPKQIPNLVERLRSRFEWGLIVDVQPPDLETKMAILDRKAEELGVELPEEVRIYIATKTKSNVRELQGALLKLVAYSSVTNTPITMPMATQCLKTLLPNQERRVTIDSVIRAVAEKYSLQPSQLKQKTNAHEISRPRQVAMYLAKELTSASLPEIGRAFGGKHHTTVLHSVRKVEELRGDNPDLNRLIHNVMDSFQ